MKKKFLKIFIAYMAISLVAVNFAFVKVETAKAGSQIEINSCLELQSIGVAEGYPLDGSYILAEDIDCSATNIPEGEDGYNENLYNSGAGFLPIGLVGATSSPFTGNFDGNNKKISKLYINNNSCGSSSSCGVGLFSVILSGSVYDLNLESVNIESKSLVIGALAGHSYLSSFSNISISGSVKNKDNSEKYLGIGGIIGGSESNIVSSSSFSGSVSGKASSIDETGILNNVGGLVGFGLLNLESSFFSGDINGANSRVGGLVGATFNSVEYNPVNVSTSSISNSYSLGRVYSKRGVDSGCSGSPSDPGLEVGGLVGAAYSAEISNSYSKASVYSHGDNFGGLVGSLNNSYLYNSYYEFSGEGIGITQGSDCVSNNVGGLVGFSNNSIISDVYISDPGYSGSISAEKNVGGLIGYLASSTLEKSFARVKNVSGRVINIDGNFFYEDYVGGLVGSSTNSSITSSYFLIPPVRYGCSLQDNNLGTDILEENLKNKENFSGLDFDNTWMMLEYPLLKLSYNFDVKIKTCGDLQNMSNNLSGDYTLENDIDCSEYSDFEPIGSPQKEFSGTLNGAGYTITGLSISKPDSDNVGLFAYLSGEVSNINFVDISIFGKNKVGVVAGESSPSSSLNNIHVNNENAGEISSIGIDDSGYWFGGLVGYFSGSIASSSFVGGEITASNYVGGLVGSMIGDEDNISSIEKSFSNTALSSESEVTQYFGGLAGYVIYSDISESYAGDLSGNVSPISASSYAGGLVGKAERTNISNTYSNISVNSYMEEGDSYLGGLVGSLEDLSIITNSYSIGVLSASGATSTIGGLVGYASNDSAVNHSFYDLTLSGMSDTGKGIATTSSQLKKDSTFSDWNLSNIWEITSDNYPTLRSITADDLEAILEEVYVNSTWTEGSVGEGLTWGQTAFSDIQTAINAVAAGGTVYLLDSSSEDYDFTLDKKINLNKAVSIIGEDLDETLDNNSEEKVSIKLQSRSISTDPTVPCDSVFCVSTSSISFLNLKLVDDETNTPDGFSIFHSKNQNNAPSPSGIVINDINISNNIILGNYNSYIKREYYAGVTAIKFTSFSKVSIKNNIIKNFRGAMYFWNNDFLNNLEISGNKISECEIGIETTSMFDNDSNIIIENNEITNNSDYAIYMGIKHFSDSIFRNNKIYNNGKCWYIQDGHCVTDSDNLNYDIYAYYNGSDSFIFDLKNNYWGSESEPNIYLFYYTYVSGDKGGWNYEPILISGSGSKDNSSIIIDLDWTDDYNLEDFKFIFRPFYTDYEMTTLSDRKISVSEENNLSSLFIGGTMNISPVDIKGEDSTKAKKIKVAEKLDIEIPAASGVASTTISLPANTEITKSDTEEDEYFTYQDLSAAELATNALSGFQSGELIGALQWGIPSVGLVFSSPVTIEMYVGTELSGQVLDLYRSVSTSGGWTKDGLMGVGGATDGTCLVNETGMCKFQTTKASYFSALKASSSDDSNSFGSSAPISLPAGIGSGARDISSISIGAALHAGEITGSGINFLTYVTNQNHFISQDSSNKREKTNHYFVINSLDLNTEIANITFFSDPKTISIKKGETKELDLDGDKVNDISVTFSNVYVNRAEITVKQLSNVATVSPEANIESTVEIIKITNDSMYNKLKGKIILKVGDNGRAYYISPIKKEMYYLGRPTDAFSVMRSQGIGITNANLDKILVNKGKASSKIDSKFTKAHLGKIFIQTELNGEAWYVNPADSSRHFLGRPNDAFQIMRNLSLGISNVDFAKLMK